MTEQTLRLEGLAVRFGAAVVLEAVSLAVGPGEIVGLIGMNGAGKTTTLRAISGLVRRTGGTVLLGDEPLPKNCDLVARAGVVHVPEGRRLFGRMTVEENLLVGGRGGRSQRLTKSKEVLQVLPRIESLLHARAGNLSGGEQQIVALARGFMSEPKILLVDEMSLGLSPAALDDVVRVLRNRADENGTGILLVDQNSEVIAKYCERIFVLEDGRTTLLSDRTSAQTIGGR